MPEKRETLVRSAQKQEAEAVAKALINLSEKERTDFEDFLKALEIQTLRDKRRAIKWER